MKTIKAKDIDEYIAGFPASVQLVLAEIRATIKAAVPEATEDIKYAMPAFSFKGTLVYFAAFTHHIGLYPAPTGIDAFKKELSVYKTGKGSIQFPLDRPMPLALITKIVQYRAKQNIAKAASKNK